MARQVPDWCKKKVAVQATISVAVFRFGLSLTLRSAIPECNRAPCESNRNINEGRLNIKTFTCPTLRAAKSVLGDSCWRTDATLLAQILSPAYYCQTQKVPVALQKAFKFATQNLATNRFTGFARDKLCPTGNPAFWGTWHRMVESNQILRIELFNRIVHDTIKHWSRVRTFIIFNWGM